MDNGKSWAPCPFHTFSLRPFRPADRLFDTTACERVVHEHHDRIRRDDLCMANVLNLTRDNQVRNIVHDYMLSDRHFIDLHLLASDHSICGYSYVS